MTLPPLEPIEKRCFCKGHGLQIIRINTSEEQWKQQKEHEINDSSNN